VNSYETSAIVEDRGQVHLAAVPFAPGTEVEVIIKPITSHAEPQSAGESDRVSRLFAALNRARNTEPIGPLRREELYDRGGP
jgi:hypothetical protein